MYRIFLLVLLMMSYEVRAVFSVENEFLLESREIVKQFSSELRGELLSSLKEGGPLNAIAVCSQKAPVIADKVSQGKNWTVARTALKYRNPTNAPDIWEQKTLESFEERRGEGEDVGEIEYYEVFSEGGQKVFRYMKAIPAGEPCLTCHGKRMPSELKAKLADLYPGDQSTGFSLGEIIGAFSIRIKLKP